MGTEDMDTYDDVAYSQAFQAVNALVEEGSISEDAASSLKKHYETIHSELLRAMASEKRHLDDAKSLKQLLDEEKRKAAEPSDQDTDIKAAMQVMVEDQEQAMGEVALAEEKHAVVELEMRELQRTRDEVMQQVEEIQEEHRQQLLPKIAQLQEEMSGLQADLSSRTAKVEEGDQELAILSAKKHAAANAKAELAVLQLERDNELSKCSQLPDKAAKQVELVLALHTQIEKQNADMLERIRRTEGTLLTAQERVRNSEDEYAMLMAAVERGNFALSGREQTMDSLKKEIAVNQIEAEQILAEKVELNMATKMKNTEHRRIQDALANVTKEKDNLLKRYKKMENIIKVSSAILPGLESQKHEHQMRVDQQNTLLVRQREQSADMKKEVDVFMCFYLNEEQNGKEKNTLFVLSHEEIMLLERQVEEFRTEGSQQARVIKELSAQRDKAARQVGVQGFKHRDCKEQGALKEIIGMDMKKNRKDIVLRLKDFQQLYDMVKNQRNRFVTLIQAARQGIAEMREKQKIMSNELDILRDESNSKDLLLEEKRNQHEDAIVERNALRAKLNKMGQSFKERQGRVDEQVAELDKLNAIINTAEKDMMRLKKQYEVIVESRNYTGIMLIDRNDELCILYEKHNIQEKVLQTGDIEMVRLDNEARMLTIDAAELTNSITITRRMLPKILVLDHNVASLQKELLLTQREAYTIEAQLEDTGNAKRWRQLPGRIPDKDELRTKMNQLEERLNDKKEQLLERELILEEVTTLSNKLRVQAASGRADTLDLARKVNDYQNRTRAITRKMMATISELSMYQATSLKLTAEKESIEEEVASARLRLADGEPPTEEAEREWKRLLREKEVALSLKEAQEEGRKILEAKGNISNTTADARPNAYIPEKLGIPKPYGGFAPFKPVEPGSTMRHIRKPVMREIVI